MEMVGGLEVAAAEEGESVARASGLSAHGEGGEAEALSAGVRGGGSRGACECIRSSRTVLRNAVVSLRSSAARAGSKFSTFPPNGGGEP